MLRMMLELGQRERCNFRRYGGWKGESKNSRQCECCTTDTNKEHLVLEGFNSSFSLCVVNIDMLLIELTSRD